MWPQIFRLRFGSLCEPPLARVSCVGHSNSSLLGGKMKRDVKEHLPPCQPRRFLVDRGSSHHRHHRHHHHHCQTPCYILLIIKASQGSRKRAQDIIAWEEGNGTPHREVGGARFRPQSTWCSQGLSTNLVWLEPEVWARLSGDKAGKLRLLSADLGVHTWSCGLWHLKAVVCMCFLTSTNGDL